MKRKFSRKAVASCVAGAIVMLATVLVACSYDVLYEMLVTESNFSGTEIPVLSFVGHGHAGDSNKARDPDTQYQQILQPYAVGSTNENAIEHSYKHRIPTMVVLPPNAKLPNGTYIGPQGRVWLTGDVRWGNTVGIGGGCDLPQKASAWGRYSDDMGKTWSKPQLIAHFDDLDMSTFSKATVRWGVTTGDPTVGRTANNRLLLLSTFGPPASGAHMNSGSGHGQTGDPHFYYNGEWYLRLRQNSKNYESYAKAELNGNGPKQSSFSSSDWSYETMTASNSEYCYAVNVKGGPIVKISDPTSVCPTQVGSDATETGLYADEYYMVYYDKEYRYPYLISQLEAENPNATNGRDNGAVPKIKADGTKIHAHLFMAMSPYICWRGTQYIGMSYSDDGGITWSRHRDITYMVRPYDTKAYGNSKENVKSKCGFEPTDSGWNTGYFFGCPTGGYLHDGMSDDIKNKFGGNKRVFFSAYAQNESETPVVYWTDDEGETWQNSGYLKGNDKQSESTIIGVPEDGSLIIISRGNGPRYRISNDGGKTWEAKAWTDLDGANTGSNVAGNNLISATPLRYSRSPSGNPLVAFSMAQQTSPRARGRVYIVELARDGNTWKFNPLFSGSSVSVTLTDDKCDYSNVRELPNGNLICVYEGSGCDTMHLKFVDLVRE